MATPIVHTGCFGAVRVTGTGAPTVVSSVRQWILNENRSTIKYQASNTQCASGRLKGKFAWSGSYSAYGSVPFVMPREKGFFEGYTAPDDRAVDMLGTIYGGNIIVDSVEIAWNWETQEPIAHVVNFSGEGPLAQGLSDPQIVDASEIDLDDVCPAKVEIATDIAAPVFDELSNITKATLSISADNKPFTNSSTACAEAFSRGAIDWTLSIDRQSTIWLTDDTPHALLSGNDYQIRLYDSATTFWLLKYGILKDHTNIEVDIENDSIVGYTKNFEMQAFGGTPPPKTIGLIAFPNTNEWWPSNIA